MTLGSIHRSLKRTEPLPSFLNNNTVAALTKGMGKEEAHEIIKEHAVASALAKEQDVGDNMLLHDLGSAIDSL